MGVCLEQVFLKPNSPNCDFGHNVKNFWVSATRIVIASATPVLNFLEYQELQLRCDHVTAVQNLELELKDSNFPTLDAKKPWKGNQTIQKNLYKKERNNKRV